MAGHCTCALKKMAQRVRGVVDVIAPDRSDGAVIPSPVVAARRPLLQVSENQQVRVFRHRFGTPIALMVNQL
jgi:hypothetical protein